MKKLLASLIGCLLALLLAPAALADEEDDDLEQTVAASEDISDDPTEISDGHVDIGAKVTDDGIKLLVRDDTQSPPAWRDPASAVLRLTDEALLEVPAEYDFLGVDEGQKVHVMPQTQLPGVLWLGWNTQDPALVRLLGDGLELVLIEHEGPGDLHLFLQNGFEEPTRLWDSTKDEEQPLWMETNTHVHANWVFTEPGVHLVTLAARGEDNEGGNIDAQATLRFAIGDEVTRDETLQAEPESEESAPTETPSSEAPPETAAEETPAEDESTPESSVEAAEGEGVEESSSLNTVWIAVGAIAVVAILAAVFAIRSRKARAGAWKDDE